MNVLFMSILSGAPKFCASAPKIFSREHQC